MGMGRLHKTVAQLRERETLTMRNGISIHMYRGYKMLYFVIANSKRFNVTSRQIVDDNS